MKQLFAAAVFATLPVTAMAETQLERLESIAEQMNDAMFDAMIRMVEKEGGNPAPLREAIPDGAWGAKDREAGACLLEKYTEASSKSAVNDMLDEMEAYIPTLATLDLDAMEDTDTDFLPEGITEEFSLQVNSECGLTDLMMDRMENSGFMEAMMKSMAGN